MPEKDNNKRINELATNPSPKTTDASPALNVGHSVTCEVDSHSNELRTDGPKMNVKKPKTKSKQLIAMYNRFLFI